MHKDRLQGILEEVKTCHRLYPEFSGVEELVRSLYREIQAFKPTPGPGKTVDFTTEEAAEALKAGTPFFGNPQLDKGELREMARVVCSKFVEEEPSLESAMRELDSYLGKDLLGSEENPWHIKDVRALISEIVEKTPVKEDLATLIVTLILPALFDDRYNLENVHRLDMTAWDKGNCPVCGVMPHYGLLKDKEGIRMLDCWLCGFRWVFPRLKCPYCLNTDQQDLGFFTVGTRESCRVHFCKKCNSYVKIFDLRSSISDDAFLPVHNMATLSYDLFALKEGFKPGSGLNWANEEEHNKSAN